MNALFEHNPQRSAVLGQLLIVVFWAIGTVVALWLTPNPIGHTTHTQLGLTPCPYVLIFDRPCPGCGLTTSIAATMEGNLRLATRSNPFGPVLYALATLAAAVSAYGLLRHQRLRLEHPAILWTGYVVLGAFFLFGFARFAMFDRFTERTSASVERPTAH